MVLAAALFAGCASADDDPLDAAQPTAFTTTTTELAGPSSTVNASSTTTSTTTTAMTPAKTVPEKAALWAAVDLDTGVVVSDTGQQIGDHVVEIGEDLMRSPDGTISVLPGPRPIDDHSRIVAANGLTVEVTEPAVSPEGFDAESPSRLHLLDVDGELVQEWPLGSIVDPWLNLIDFNGQVILVARRPLEPVFPLVEHFVIDITCAECLDVFETKPGMATLLGADVTTQIVGFDVDTFLLCPTWSFGDPIAAPVGLHQPFVASFDRLANSIARCDDRVLRFADTPVATEDSASWLVLRELLASEPAIVDGRPQWRLTDEWGAVSSMAPDPTLEGDLRIELVRFSAGLPASVVLENDRITLWGSVDAQSAEEFREAARFAASVRGFEIVDLIRDDGPRLGDATRELFGEFIGSGLASTFVLEAEGTVDGANVVVWASTEPAVGSDFSFVDGSIGETVARTGVGLEELVEHLDVTPAEQSLADQLVGFAAGGSLDSELFAPRVLFGLGPVLTVPRLGSDLTDPDVWTLPAEQYAGYVGPFSALDSMAGSKGYEVTVGPHTHCAGAARPAPTELAGSRRISIRPSEVGMCPMEWWAVDLFVDADGLVVGVVLDLYEP